VLKRTETSHRRRRTRSSPRRLIRLAFLTTTAVFIGLFLVAYGPYWVNQILGGLDPDRAALRTALTASNVADLKPDYALRDFKPVWMAHQRPTPDAADLIHRLSMSGQDGLNPERYGVRALSRLIGAAPQASPADRARTELLLTRAYTSYVTDLHAPLVGADIVYTDHDLKPGRPTVKSALIELATAPSVHEAMLQATQMNPIYLQYRQALARQRAAGDGDAATTRLLLINLERARALPADLGARFVLVDVAAGQLQLYENGRAVDAMTVVVGTPTEQTPAMAGVIRYALFNPYWNVPPDLTRATYAPRIKARPASLGDLQMDVWSDSSDGAEKLDPKTVNWAGVAKGSDTVWLRQRPGGQNAMGAVKFMLPNELGIYLHDTPNKTLFDKAPRDFSAGCVRVEDYKRLARWLFKGKEVGPNGAGPDQRINLPDPTPVYITYLTVGVENGAVIARPDIYHRDEALLTPLAPPASAG
jgi:murein L,D-transpeptidase YcbB/YkuD